MEKTPMRASEDPKVIYLAPQCQVDAGEGRQWCQDDVWSGDGGCCADPKCKHKPTKYMLMELKP